MHFVISIISRFVPSIYDIANPELAFAEFFEKNSAMEGVEGYIYSKGVSQGRDATR